MSILDPDHLLEQADRLVAPPPKGPPRQVDLRRGISSAYYALFHLTLTALSDEIVGALHQNTPRYALVHRGVDHRTIKDLCLTLSKSSPPTRYAPYAPPGFFGRHFLAYASGFVTLQEERHRADYDVSARYRTLNAKSAIAQSRSALVAFRTMSPAEKKMFLTLLLCPPR
ncbi:hypothetical protein D3273_13920 [Lichenibacterium minor]|uniref:HEPN domain-containing protein n=1 Tax=Lichenibacterium minor TaxID=2316528 RepID=A0A4Q2U590_9HYPH|nr:hypothetical protein [Lichenibacterium minor]RYC31470.1 hypothetical protein D3273_13920 [Lichenibacterium minor]